MVKLIYGILLALFLTACSTTQVDKETIVFDYFVSPTYPINDQYKYISVVVDDSTLQWPQTKLAFESLKLNYTASSKKADIIVYIHFSPSFLVQRAPISRKVVTFDENNRGTMNYVKTNRGYIRTSYSIEVVDKIKDHLIFHTQAADNFEIDAVPKPELAATENALKTEFYNKRPQARTQLLEKIWHNLEAYYLKDITVKFGQDKFNVVSHHGSEGMFNQAYKLLKNNDKTSAQKALNMYNQALKKYEAIKDKSDEHHAIIEYINDGITAASKITNHTYQSRY